MKWCSECGIWGNHLRTGHPASEDNPGDEGGGDLVNVGMRDEGVQLDDSTPVEEYVQNVEGGSGTCARLRGPD